MTRQALGFAGILLAALGLAYDRPVVIWIATALLTVSVGWRVIASRRSRRLPPAGDDSGD